MVRPAAFGVFGLIVAASMAACGGSDVEKAEPEDWVDDICSATSKLSDSESDAANAYMDLDTDDGEELRDAFADYVREYGKALDRFASSAERAGQPDIDDGDKVAAAVQAWVKEEHRNFDRANRKVKDLKEKDDDLIDAVDDVFYGLEFADLLKLLEDTDAREADDIIDLFDEDEECSGYLFTD